MPVNIIYEKQEDIPAATKRSNFLGLPAVIVIIATASAIEEYGDENLYVQKLFFLQS